ncbi:unnamed protein product [Paramecium primaurelia]|uniref:Uncharacterized protein n=1 Tax=Paramecium primaurelia TaxID=5886 RepID=A0A8S1QGA5_PARPR|nr:unnamed protein product [Paramecium primaurelia]
MNSISEEQNFSEEPYQIYKSNSIIKTFTSFQQINFVTQLNNYSIQLSSFPNAEQYDRTIQNSNIIIGTNLCEQEQDEMFSNEEQILDYKYEETLVEEKQVFDNQFFFNKFQLEGCGFNFNLIHLLWLQDPIFKNNIRLDIPDTIQILQGQPHFWYYSVDSQIMRKSKTKLNLESILKDFVKDKNDNHEICAVWITKKDNQTEFEFLSQYLLCQLISQMNYETEGYLQKFIYPKSEKNEVIKCTWGNNLCYFEVFTNKYPIMMQKADIYQRAVTFETQNGPVEQSTLKGTQFCQRLELLCGLIMSHVINVTQNQKEITLMELIFKLSKKGQIYLIICSNLSTSNVPTKFSLPDFSITKKVTKELLNYPKAITLSDNSKCIVCDEEKNQIEFSKVKLKELIHYWESGSDHRSQVQSPKSHRLHAQLIKIDPTQLIPRVIKLMYPRMSLEEYQEFRNNTVFINQTISLCSYCFTKLYQSEEEKVRVIPRKHNRLIKTEIYDNEPIKYDPITPGKTKKTIYCSFLEHKVINNYINRRLKLSNIKKESFPMINNSNSLFKTTQSSRIKVDI